METPDTNNIVQDFEKKVSDDLTKFLQGKGLIDKHVPECPDVEGKWPEIIRAYLPDGVREFQNYPVVSLGWIMFVGMAMAYYWDTDWGKYGVEHDYYQSLRDRRGYDYLDEVVVHDVLGYDEAEGEKVIDLVAQCASRVYGILSHEHIEPGTEAAFGCYLAALSRLFRAGMAMELNTLGYHMQPLN